MDDGPTYGYVPIVYYYAGRVREGLKSHSSLTSTAPILKSAATAPRIPCSPKFTSASGSKQEKLRRANSPVSFFIQIFSPNVFAGLSAKRAAVEPARCLGQCHFTVTTIGVRRPALGQLNISIRHEVCVRLVVLTFWSRKAGDGGKPFSVVILENLLKFATTCWSVGKSPSVSVTFRI